MPDPGRPRLAIAAALFAVACTGAVLARLMPDETLRIAGFLSGVRQSAGPAGWVLVAAAEIAAALCGIVPASIIAVAAGMIYGTVPGFAVCAPALLVGGVVAFWFSRSLFRARAARFIGRDPRLLGLDAAVARDGWRLVCLIRLSPVMPFALTSYALGLTSLDLVSYLVGTGASLPPLLLYTGLGSFARHGMQTVSAGDSLLHLLVPAISLAATVVLAVRLGQIVTRTLRETAGLLKA